jgi:F0F1-type ATP synthase delta subunit
MAKTRLNLSLDQDLVDFIKLFAAENRTTAADVVTQYLLALKRKSEGQSTAQILSHPAFHEAMEQVQAKLQDGTARWHSFDEVFGD